MRLLLLASCRVALFAILRSGSAAACEITNPAPTGVIPTTPSQPFTFVATNDCAMLSFVALGGSLTKTPRPGMMIGTDSRRYSVSLTLAEWNMVAGSVAPRFAWTVSGRTGGTREEVTTRNDLDFDGDGWTRSEGDLDCDLDAASNPGVPEICDNSNDDNCDGMVDECLPGDPDGVVGTDQVLTLGLSRFSAAGDVDGDGIDDLVLGSQRAYDSQGGVYVVPGPVAGPVDVADHFGLVPGPLPIHDLSQSVAVGDVDLDGVDDILTGTFGRWGIYVYLGPITADRRISGADALLAGPDSSLTGESTAILGDFDGDGAPDLVAGNGAGDQGGTGVNFNNGTVYVTSNALSDVVDLETSSTYQIIGARRGDYLGRVVEGIGDATGDGIDDLALPVPYGDRISTVYFVDGGAAPGTYDVGDAAWASVAAADSDGLHSAVASGDYDGDGAADLIVADYRAESSDGVAEAGVVYAFLGPVAGSVPNTDAATRWEGTADAYVMGAEVTVSDIDGDGALDLLMGSFAPNDGAGAAYFQFGVATGTVSVDTLPLYAGKQEDSYFGSDAGIVLGDWTGDGIAELAISAYGLDGLHGAVYVYESDGRY